MYTIDAESYTADIGRVAVRKDKKTGYLRIRFTYPKGVRRDFRVASQTPDGFLKAQNIAQKINRDIEMGCFDHTLASYSEFYALRLAEKQKELNLKEIWENYKLYNRDRVAETTRRDKWSMCERLLERSTFLELDHANSFVREQLDSYSLKSLIMIFNCCLHPALNFAVKQKKLTENPYHVPTPKQVEADIDCYESAELELILDAFQNNTFCSKKSAYKHDYYHPYTYFQVLTGTRPENTCALTWKDLVNKGGRTYIKMNKVYYRGILQPFTKNKTIILFPVNGQLKQLLDSLPKTSDLLFPSVKGKYFNSSNYNRRIWKPIIRGLIECGSLDRYLPPYNLRHSFITRMIREGLDVATIAALSGNSTEIIIKRYLKARHQVDIPLF